MIYQPSNDDSDSGSIGRIRSRDSSPRVTRRAPNVILAKIFMVTIDPTSCQKPKEWDGKDPGHTKRLFVYAHIDNSTYESYVTLSDSSHKRFKYVNTLGDGRPYHRDYDKLMQIAGPFSKYFQSCIHNPRAYDSYRWPNSPELETVLRNLMSGTLSFVNSRDVLDLHRIYVFDPDSTPPIFTYWYRLNNSSGQDGPMQGPPDDETIRDIPEHEFTSNYKIFRKFRQDNSERHKFYGELGKLSRGGKKHSKRRNKTRRKYRKIKSRRRRVVR